MNFSLLVDALRVAGITVRRRAILNVIASICPFLVDKDAVDKIPEVLPQENTEKKNVKSTMIQFGAIDCSSMKQNPLSMKQNPLSLL